MSLINDRFTVGSGLAGRQPPLQAESVSAVRRRGRPAAQALVFHLLGRRLFRALLDGSLEAFEVAADGFFGDAAEQPRKQA